MIVTTVKVEGMMCSHCEKHIEEAIKQNFDIKSVSASKDKDEVLIKSKLPLDREKIERAVTDAGYKFVSSSEKEEKFSLFGKQK